MKAKVVNGSFSETIACPICSARLFFGYKHKAWLTRCLNGHTLVMRPPVGTGSISDNG